MGKSRFPRGPVEEAESKRIVSGGEVVDDTGNK